MNFKIAGIEFGNLKVQYTNEGEDTVIDLVIPLDIDEPMTPEEEAVLDKFLRKAHPRVFTL